MSQFDLQVASKQKKSPGLDPVVALFILIQTNPSIYEEAEPFMLEPGVTGSKGDDKTLSAWTVFKMIEVLAADGNSYAIELAKLPFGRIKALIPRALRRIGLDVRNGKVYGYLTHSSAEDEEGGDFMQEPTVEVAPTVQSAYIQ